MERNRVRRTALEVLAANAEDTPSHVPSQDGQSATIAAGVLRLILTGFSARAAAVIATSPREWYS